MKAVVQSPITNRSHSFIVKVFCLVLDSEIDDFQPLVELITNRSISITEEQKKEMKLTYFFDQEAVPQYNSQPLEI